MKAKNDIAFESAGGWVVQVDFEADESMARYAEARAWCRLQCKARWRCSPNRLAKESVFEFEDERDATLFPVFFDVLRQA